MSKSENRTERRKVINERFTPASAPALKNVQLNDLKTMSAAEIRRAYEFGPDENPGAIRLKPMKRAGASAR